MQINAVSILEDNYVWLIEGENRQCVLVDLGEAEPVLAAIAARKLIPQAILLTHHHGDHTAGIAAFRAHYPVPVIGPATEAQAWVTEPKTDAAQFSIPGVGDFQVMVTPGHTLGHLTFVTDGAAFTGDTLFTAGCGRLFEGTAAQMCASLDRIAQLPDDTLIYCGHEYTADSLRFAQYLEPQNSVIAQRIESVNRARAASEPTVPALLSLEKQTNPFLRIREPAVRQAICQHAGQASLEDVEAFGVLRRWKDEFDGLRPL